MAKAETTALAIAGAGVAAGAAIYIIGRNRWATIAEGASLEEFKMVADVEELPKGTPFRVIFDTKLPVAPLADLFGTEAVLRMFLEQGEGTVLEDIEGVGAYRIILHFRAGGGSPGVPPLLIIGIIIAAALSLSFLIAAVRMEAPVTVFTGFYDTIKWVVIGAMVVAALFYLTQAKLIARAA